MPVDHKARARRAWKHLVARTLKAGPPFTYSELGNKIGVFYRHLSKPLGFIQSHCKKAGWPRLQAMVVHQASPRLPGKGYKGEISSPAHAREIEKVRAKKNWPRQAPF